MMNILIVLNHQPKIPPFMLTALHCAKYRYDEVYYVNTQYPRFAEIFFPDKNVNFLQPTAWGRRLAMIKAFFSMFKKTTLNNIRCCMKDKGFKVNYLKPFLVGLSSDACIRPIADNLIKQNRDNSITVLSTWLAYCAYSAACLKKDHNNIKSISLAHSYEILLTRNPLVPYHFVDFKHKYLDGIYFIAYTMRDMYLEGVGQLPLEYLKRMHVCHLGSYKTYSNLNKTHQGVFNICSCSRVIPLKRLDILIAALENWSYGKIRWTHMGNGPIFDDLKAKAEDVMAKNPMVEINLKGFVSNSEVEAYYANNPVDVFINLSNIEGLPISIMEAVSYGIPVIATNVGGTKEIVTSKIGILLPENITPKLVMHALYEFYVKSDVEREVIRTAAYDSWRKNFDATNNLNKLFELINRN